MRKYNLGDLIRATHDVGDMLIKGNIYEVIDIKDSFSSTPLVTIRDSRGIINDFFEFRFEPVKPSKKIGEFM
jgi:hypothetical protein